MATGRDMGAMEDRLGRLADDLRGTSAPWPAPLAEEAYYALAGDIVRKVEPETEADPVAVLLQLLVFIGNAAGRAPHFWVGATRHSLNEFVALVGDTSKARKGTALDLVKAQLKAVDADWMWRVKSGLSSGEGLTWEIRDPIVTVNRKTGQKEEADPGEADKRLMVVQGELAEVLRRMEREGNSLSSTLRDAWDSAPLASMVKTSPGRCAEPHVSVVGHITKDELTRYLTRTEMANGLGNRFLWACVKRTRLLPRGGGEVTLNAERKRLWEALAFARSTGEIRMSDAAWAAWEAVYGPLSEGKPGLFGPMTARAEAHVRRLAAIYAVLDQSKVVRREHLYAALAVWDYCEASVRYIFGDSLGDPDADQVLDALRSAGDAGMTDNDLHEHFQRHWTSARRARALASLEAKGMVRRAKDSPNERGGRPATRYYLVVGSQGDASVGYLEIAKRGCPCAESAESAETPSERQSEFVDGPPNDSAGCAETSERSTGVMDRGTLHQGAGKVSAQPLAIPAKTDSNSKVAAVGVSALSALSAQNLPSADEKRPDWEPTVIAGRDLPAPDEEGDLW